jgi:hypothetical protein
MKRVGCSIVRPPEGVRYKIKRTGKGENGERGRKDCQVLGRALRGDGGTGWDRLCYRKSKGATLDARGAWMAWICTTRVRARRALPLLEEN